LTGLAEVLRHLPTFSHPDVIVGPEHFSDAGVIRVAPGLALVQTVDFFPPLVDDPYMFGRIAAANSLSDCYAMGGRPISVLNIVGFPDDQLPVSILGQILCGGADKSREAGAAVLGGHSVRDVEIKFGLSVTGVVDPEKLVTNEAARPGDRLVLTKPLGTGVITTASKIGRVDAGHLAAACDSMQRLNKDACEAMLAVNAKAATDITGFGMIGHSRGMADASNVTIELHASQMPWLEGAMHYARKGYFTRAAKTNPEFLADKVELAGGVDDLTIKMLYDAQTSGGLFISIAPDRLDALLAELKQRGVPAAVVGTVLPRGMRSVVVRS